MANCIAESQDLESRQQLLVVAVESETRFELALLKHAG
jgi:hypothetical protein